MRYNPQFAASAIALFGIGLSQSAPRQVAIIGAGAAGSSAAYHLQSFAAEAGVRVNVTIFEKENRIGGRTLTVNPFGNRSQPVELGASIFVEANQIMYGAVQEFNMSLEVPDPALEPTMGIWDGDRFVLTIDERHPSWWNGLKIVLRYGPHAVQRTTDMVSNILGKFLPIYQAPFFPFRSLTQVVDDLGLDFLTSITGQKLLDANNINQDFGQHIVQASTRVNYASNIANLQGLTTAVSLAAAGSMAVQGGNWKIFTNMVEKSGAVVALNTTVTGLEFHNGGPKYTLLTSSGSSSMAYPVAFDHVILASPYQFSGISAATGVLRRPIEKVPYVRLHVTLFASTRRLYPGYFNSSTMPRFILTTLSKTDTPNSGPQGVGKAGFFSINIVRTAVNPATQRSEFVYKIFSPEPITPQFLSSLLGAAVPPTFTGAGSPISWYYPHVFDSYPAPPPRTTFQDPIVGHGIYYTSGIETLASAMEMSALMGKNVARVLVEDIVASTSALMLIQSDENSMEGQRYGDRKRTKTAG